MSAETPAEVPQNMGEPGSFVAAQPAEPESAPPAGAGPFWGTGRRKGAVARVRVLRGNGKFLINGRTIDNYFTEVQARNDVVEPLTTVNAAGRYDVHVNARGGGHSGQAGAVRLGVARALVKAEEQFEAALRDRGLLTRDSRIVERKKYGQRKARRRFQFSKR
jgi:small subunit ribosomal protein S9